MGSWSADFATMAYIYTALVPALSQMLIDWMVGCTHTLESVLHHSWGYKAKFHCESTWSVGASLLKSSAATALISLRGCERF